MSEVKNIFSSFSGIKIKCTHSTEGESLPPIEPGPPRDGLGEVGGSDKYLILQAIKNNGEVERSKIHNISCIDNNYEPRPFYVEEYCIWVIWAIRKSGIGPKQTNVNVEIGP